MPTSSLRRRILIPVLAVVLPSLLCLLALELALRASGFRSPVIHAEMFSIHADDPLLPYSLRPGYRGDYGGGSVTVGESGYRVVPLPAGVDETFSQEIVLLGDSTAFGQGLDDDATIAAHLQARVPARVTVIAAPGYTSWNEYMALSKYPALSRVRAVVLIYDPNDMTTDNDHFDFAGHGEDRINYIEQDVLHQMLGFLYEHSRVAYLIADSIKKSVWLMAHAAAPAEVSADPAGLAASLAAIDKIDAFCEAHGIEFIVAIYRGMDFYRRPAWSAEYESQLADGLEGIGVDHILLKDATDRLDEARFSVSWNDSHPGPEASRIIAAEIARALGSRDLMVR